MEGYRRYTNLSTAFKLFTSLLRIGLLRARQNPHFLYYSGASWGFRWGATLDATAPCKNDPNRTTFISSSMRASSRAHGANACLAAKPSPAPCAPHRHDRADLCLACVCAQRELAKQATMKTEYGKRTNKSGQGGTSMKCDRLRKVVQYCSASAKSPFFFE